ncbi:hypothetical protein [Streptomyces sp. NPDC056723]
MTVLVGRCSPKYSAGRRAVVSKFSRRFLTSTVLSTMWLRWV